MPTEITLQNLEVQNNKLVVKPQTVPIPDIDDIPKTLLASVPETATVTSVVVIQNGAVRQISLSDFAALLGI